MGCSIFLCVTSVFMFFILVLDLGNPLELRQNYVNKTITSNVIGYVWETQAINTYIFIFAPRMSIAGFEAG